MKNIEINISNKIATLKERFVGVCGNSDYVVVFDFDDEWKSHATKTARFKHGGQYTDVVFTGNECPMPIILDTASVEIGVYAGNLHTTTSACVLMKTCILSGGGVPADPTPDVYNQIIDKIDAGMLKGADGAPGKDGVSPTVDVNKSGDTTTIAITDANGVHTAEIKDGAKGDKGADGSDATVTAANIETALGYVPVTPSALAAKQDVLTDADRQLITKTGMTTGAAWTSDEQKAARERMGVDNACELIDEITTDGAAIIERTQEPDGTPYDFEKVMLVVTAPKQMGASVVVFADFFTDNTHLSSYTMFPANKNYFYRSLYVGEIRNGLLEYRSVEASIVYGSTQGGGSGDASSLKQSATPRFTSSNITRVRCFGSNSTALPAGFLIQIYGVRA